MREKKAHAEKNEEVNRMMNNFSERKMTNGESFIKTKRREWSDERAVARVKKLH